MLPHPLLQGRSRGNDAVHADGGVTDGQSGCTCGFWIQDSWAGTGKRGGIKDHRGAEGYKHAYHSLGIGYGYRFSTDVNGVTTSGFSFVEPRGGVFLGIRF